MDHYGYAIHKVGWEGNCSMYLVITAEARIPWFIKLQNEHYRLPMNCIDLIVDHSNS